MDVEINGRLFQIESVYSRNRNAAARLRDGKIVISIPSRWPDREKERIGSNLLKRAIKAIEKGRWRVEGSSRVVFNNGQRLMTMGRDFEIVFTPSSNFGCSSEGNRITVGVVESHPKAYEKASSIARKEIVERVLPDLIGRIESYNRLHFQARIPKVTVRDNTSRWGSCSPDCSISLNFRLLFMPEDILDYVIVHELAHTKYRSHGKRFWGLVETVVPDHKAKRKWLRENGWKVPKDEAPMRNDQLTLKEFSFEEPY